jgi:hypothetical protein
MKKDKEFDSVKMMRDIRDKMSIEMIDMNTVQILDYIKKGREEYEKLISEQQKSIISTD